MDKRFGGELMWNVTYNFDDASTFSVSSEIELDRSMNISESEISHRLKLEVLDKLVYELMNSDAIKFSFNSSPTNTYSNRVRCVADTKILKNFSNTNYIRPKNVFKYRDIEWSEEEIKKALDNTYPYRLI